MKKFLLIAVALICLSSCSVNHYGATKTNAIGKRQCIHVKHNMEAKGYAFFN